MLVVSSGGEVGSHLDPAITSAVPNCPSAFLMPWRGSHALHAALDLMREAGGPGNAGEK